MAPQRSMPCRMKVFRSCRFGKLGCVCCTIARGVVYDIYWLSGFIWPLTRITNPQKSTNTNRSPDLRNFVVSQLNSHISDPLRNSHKFGYIYISPVVATYSLQYLYTSSQKKGKPAVSYH